MRTCSCGGREFFTIGSICKNYEGKSVKILNVPEYECASCGRVTEDVNHKIISTALSASVERGLKEIDYTQAIWGIYDWSKYIKMRIKRRVTTLKYEIQITERDGFKETSEENSPNDVLYRLSRHLRDNDELKKIVVKVKE